jgi:hypothetical protein
MLPPIRFSFYRKAIGVERSILDLIFFQHASAAQSPAILGHKEKNQLITLSHKGCG